MKGLKRLRSGKGRVNPNLYWKRAARVRCVTCGRKVRGPNHTDGHR